jgi:hypothetical protein
VMVRPSHFPQLVQLDTRLYPLGRTIQAGVGACALRTGPWALSILSLLLLQLDCLQSGSYEMEASGDSDVRRSGGGGSMPVVVVVLVVVVMVVEVVVMAVMVVMVIIVVMVVLMENGGGGGGNGNCGGGSGDDASHG